MNNTVKKNYFWHTTPIIFTFWYSLFTILAFNLTFIQNIYKIHLYKAEAFFSTLVLFCALNIVLNIFSFLRIIRPLAIVFCLLNSIALYFMNAYGVVIDKIMFMNVLQTDIYEVHDLLNIKMLQYLFIFGLLPSFLIYKTEIVYPALKQASIVLSAATAIYGIVSTVIILGFYPRAENILRQFRHLKNSLIPANYIGALISVTKNKIAVGNYELQKISEDAHMLSQGQESKPNLIVVVIGESARADNFSLQGYHRPTNQPLEKYADSLLYFSNFSSCGTSTAISLPCLFSKDSRLTFVPESERYTENVLDIIQHAGYKLVWRENNTDCKDNCNRIELEKFCQTKECPDEILLTDFAKKIHSTNKPTLMVLHQRGSHGPLYRLRYPEQFGKYAPVCEEEYLQDCLQQDIINAYDNSIFYTSYMLAKTLEELEKLSKEYNIAFLFVSDHGESLGENNIYLHSAPYDTAPAHQTHIPMMLWFSDGYIKTHNLNKQCLQDLRKQPFSHDNIFHTLLGISRVSSRYYEEKLDMLAPCRQ